MCSNQYFGRILTKFGFGGGGFLLKSPVSYSTEMRPVGAVLVHADGRTDGLCDRA